MRLRSRVTGALWRLVLLGFATAVLLPAQKPVVRIGVLLDGPAEGNDATSSLFQREIAQLLAEEYDVQFPAAKRLTGDWTAAGAGAAIDQLLADPEVDHVLTLGFIGSQVIAGRGPLPKPSFAAFVSDPSIQGIPSETLELPVAAGETESITVSGVANLSYVTMGIDTDKEVVVYREVSPFSRLAVLSMGALREAFPDLEARIKQGVTLPGLNRIDVVWVGGSVEQAVAEIPADSDAVLVTFLSQWSSDDFDQFIAALIERKLPSFTLSGVDQVERGILATMVRTETFVRRARRIAVNMQQVLSGEPAAHMRVDFDRRERLTINMATARAIGVSPTFKIMTEAELLNEERTIAPRTLSLASVIREAENVNLDLAVADRNVTAGLRLVKLARSALLPQFEISGGATFIDKDRAALGAGQNPQRLLSGTISGSQLLYSDDVKASYDIERSLQDLREEERAQLRLDIVLEAAETYLNVLRAKTVERVQKNNLSLTRSNLELAQVRVDIGQAGREEVFRWESQIAINRRDVVDASAFRNQAEIALNRILNRPSEESFLTTEAGLNDPELITSFEQIQPYVETPAVFDLFRDFMTQEGFAQSPELRQLEASVRARQREVTASSRSFYIPRVGASAEGTMLGRYGEGSQQPPGILSSFWTNRYNWSVGIGASLPVFQGGAQRARLGRAEEELQRATLQRDATQLRVEERIRSVLHQTGASFVGIELAADAAEAARRNLDLVRDRYAEGIAEILVLLDAQNQALGADLAAANAIFDYLIDLVGAQRAVGRFDYFRSTEDRQDFLNRLDEFVRSAGYQPRQR